MRALVLASSVGVLLGLGLSSCGQPLCTSNAQCPGGEICLPAGQCAFSCTTDTQCRTDEKCSASGGCVKRAGGCGTNADCNGQYCHPGGTCHAEPPPAPSGGDAGMASCGGEKFEATRTQANMLIVLDHSGSMMEMAGNATKWSSAVAAVKKLTSQNTNIRFGLQMFSYNSLSCHPGQVLVPVGDANVTAIANALPGNADGRGTPIAGALSIATQAPEIYDATRANYVLLITDGMENCGGDPVARVDTLFAKNVRTYTVGFGNAVDAQNLNQMAIKGGTARAGSKRYYQADNSTDLEAALSAIAQGALGCDFRLAQAPPDASKLYVAIDGQFVPRDPSRQSGWEYTAASNRVTLYGPACDALTRNPNAKVSIVYGCPDPTITETGTGGVPDGGYVFTLDGGEMIN